MKQIITNNLILKAVSLAVAFICWLVIINFSDPTITRKFDGIPVTVLNENAITSADCVYEIVAGDTVNVTVKGKRSIVERIRKEYFTAKADLSKLSKVNAVSIDVFLAGVETESLEWDWNNAVLKVSLEKKSTESFKVAYRLEGELLSSLALGDVMMEPSILEVSGGASILKKIKSVGVVINLNGRSKDFGEELKPILYDADGNVLELKNVTFNTDKILVSAPVIPTKEIPVSLGIRGVPKAGYRLVNTDFQPRKIRIAGPEEVLKNINAIEIPVNISGKSKDVESSIDVTSLLDSQVIIAEEYEMISYRCIIEKDGERTITLTNTDIAFLNKGEDLECTFQKENQKYFVEVSGHENVLKDINSASIEPYLDLSGIGVGVYTLELKFKIPEGIKVVNRLKAKVNLVKPVVSEKNGGE